MRILPKKIAAPDDSVPEFCTNFPHTASKSSLRPIGVEPITYGSEDHCSIQLSYGRGVLANCNLGDSCRWLKGNRREVAVLILAASWSHDFTFLSLN